MLWFLLLLPLSASAHNGPPLGLQPFVVDGELVAAGGTSGVVLQEDGVATWACEDAFFLTPSFWHIGADQRILAGTTAGMWESTDLGCNWHDRKSLPPRFWAARAAAGPTLWMATADRDRPNGIWRSDDDGQTVRRLPLTTEERLVELAEQDGVLFVLAASDDGPSLRRSEDGGESFGPALPWPGWSATRLFGVSSDGTRLLMGATSETGRFWYLEQDAALASPPVPVQDFYAPITAAADLAGRRFLVTGLERLWAQGESEFEIVREDAFSCLKRIDGELWACGVEPDSAIYQRSADGVGWTDALAWADIVPRECPADSDYAQLCPDAWERVNSFLVPRTGDDDDDAADDDDAVPVEPGCGGGQAWLLLAALGIGRPRRRARG